MLRNQEKLRGIYYPYAYPRTVEALKYSLLIFDEIWLVDPLTRDYRWALMYSEHGEAWDEIRRSIDYLCDKGFVRIFDPRSTVNERDHELATAIMADSRDPAFNKISHVLQGQRWSVAIERVPPSLRPEIGNNAVHGFLPVFMGFMMNVNLTLAITQDNPSINLIPFTDFEVAQHAFSVKYGKVVGFPRKLSVDNRRTPEQLFSYPIVAINLLHQIVSPEVLTALSLKDIVTYRKRARAAMELLRRKLFSVIHLITGPPLSQEAGRELIQVLDELSLEEQRARGELYKVNKDFSSGLAAGVAAGTIPSLVACVYSTNPTFDQLLAVGAASLVGVLGAQWHQRRVVAPKTDLSFFLNLNQERPLRFQRWIRAFESAKSRKRMISYLGQAVGDPDPYVQRIAVKTLAELKDGRCLRTLISAIESEDHLVNFLAMEGLENLEEELSIRQWRKILKQGFHTEKVFIALVRLASQDAFLLILEEINDAIKRKMDWTQTAGWRALAEADPGCHQTLIHAVNQFIQPKDIDTFDEDFVSRVCWLIAKVDNTRISELFFVELLRYSEDRQIYFHPMKHLAQKTDWMDETREALKHLAINGHRDKAMLASWFLLGKGLQDTSVELAVRSQLKIFGQSFIPDFHERHMVARTANSNTVDFLLRLTESGAPDERKGAWWVLKEVLEDLEGPFRDFDHMEIEEFRRMARTAQGRLDAHRSSSYAHVLHANKWTETHCASYRYL